jgi:phosphate transport system permease protein
MSPTTLQEIRANVVRRKLGDRLFIILGFLVVAIAIGTLFSLLFKLFLEGLPSLSPNFFLSFPSRHPEQAGILSAWVGTSLIMLVTAILAIPLGVASGLYLEEYAYKNWLADLIEINVTNLAGVPSIIYGLLALGLFVAQFNLGESILTAGCTLALLILPIVIVTTREAIRSVPLSIREASYALGASKWQTIWDHVLPCSLGSILTGIVIGLSRAIGETAPLITIGALTFIAFLPKLDFKSTFPFMTWLEAPFTVMPIQMFNWVSRPDPAFQANAAAAGTILITMTLMMNGFAIYLRYRFRKGVRL